MSRQVTASQQPGVYGRMQGFYPAVKTFGKARDVGHIGNREPLFFKVSGRSPRGDQFPPGLDQKRRQTANPLFIEYAYKRPSFHFSSKHKLI
jgi:hypothetical protein